MQIKRCYQYLFGSIAISSLTLACFAFTCTALYFCRETKAAVITCSIGIAMEILCEALEIFVCNAFEYWGMDETTVYIKRLFRKKVSIPFDRIESVEETVVREPIDTMCISLRAYMIHGDGKTICIWMTNKKIAILEERLKPYMKESVPQADAPQT